jgi:hypothetical protein
MLGGPKGENTSLLASRTQTGSKKAANAFLGSCGVKGLAVFWSL